MRKGQGECVCINISQFKRVHERNSRNDGDSSNSSSSVSWQGSVSCSTARLVKDAVPNEAFGAQGCYAGIWELLLAKEKSLETLTRKLGLTSKFVRGDRSAFGFSSRHPKHKEIIRVHIHRLNLDRQAFRKETFRGVALT